MKATSKFNKAAIMIEAWRFYRMGYGSFSNCMKAAWRGAKFEIEQANAVTRIEAQINTRKALKKLEYDMMSEEDKYNTFGMGSYYRSGVYSGD